MKPMLRLTALLYAGACGLGLAWYAQSYAQNPTDLFATMAVVVALLSSALIIPHLHQNFLRRAAALLSAALGLAGLLTEQIAIVTDYKHLVDRIVQSIWVLAGVLVVALLTRVIWRMNESEQN